MKSAKEHTHSPAKATNGPKRPLHRAKTQVEEKIYRKHSFSKWWNLRKKWSWLVLVFLTWVTSKNSIVGKFNSIESIRFFLVVVVWSIRDISIDLTVSTYLSPFFQETIAFILAGFPILRSLITHKKSHVNITRAFAFFQNLWYNGTWTRINLILSI